MSTPMFVDLEISTQADGAQSPRVPVLFPEDPYEAIRHAYLVETDTKFKRFEDPVETETPDSPSSSPPDLPSRKRSWGTSELVEDDEDKDGEDEDEEVDESSDSDSESEDAEDDGPTAEDKGLVVGDEGSAVGDEGLAAGDVGPAVGELLGMGYGALRRQEIASREGQMPSVFEVGQGSGSVPEPERLERVSTLRQSTLTTWIDPKDGRAYINVLAYPPPAPRVQTPPSPEWLSSSLPVSRSFAYFTTHDTISRFIACSFTRYG
ncbi:hypothetical protein Tco_0298899, partial [Tanacetum coccineum]